MRVIEVNLLGVLVLAGLAVLALRYRQRWLLYVVGTAVLITVVGLVVFSFGGSDKSVGIDAG